jgi:rhamnopyranosyl-N-acetylglucosaminyl-diphospho-decaprenol beta-1,3/1,4-galactofuranosyltransferase
VLGQLRAGDRLMVIDNASEPPASKAIESFDLADRVEVVRLERNLGPAGGYAHGLRRFLETDHGLVWILDDDMVPGAGTLARVRSASLAESDPVVVFPRVLDRQGKPFDFPAWCGVLIQRTIVEHVGVPREEYFWWGEDSEYLQWRIPRAGYRTVRANDATMVHEAVRRGRTKPAWKFYYEIRNLVHYRLNVQMPAGVPMWRCTRKLLRTVVRTFGGILLREDHKATKLRAVARGISDGLAGRLGIREDPRDVAHCPPRL